MLRIGASWNMNARYLFIRLADGAVGHRWNGNDEKGARTHHGFISEQDNSTDIVLHWKSCENATSRYIGAFRLDLTELLNAGFIRTDKYRGAQGFRVKFVHASNGSIYLQRDSDSPRLSVGVFE